MGERLLLEQEEAERQRLEAEQADVDRRIDEDN